jgi:GDP-4-dehydro-6-deoxy-D-mannose reductase
VRALVIGADGFVGRWLVRHLTEHGDEVTRLVGPRWRPDEADAEAHQVDVTDSDRVTRLISANPPTVVYYLAGVSQAERRESVRLATEVSVVGILNVLTACAEFAPMRLVHVGSALAYPPQGETAIDENVALAPDGIYGAAKAVAETACLTIGPQVGIEVIAVRPFNHIGPGQSSSFVVPSLARQVAAIPRGSADAVIRTGNVDVRRDFTDVRDVVRAYRCLAERGVAGEIYNVASGTAPSIREILETLLDIAGVQATLAEDPDLVRDAEPMVMKGNAAKLRKATGWQPEVPLRETLSDVLDEARLVN